MDVQAWFFISHHSVRCLRQYWDIPFFIHTSPMEGMIPTGPFCPIQTPPKISVSQVLRDSSMRAELCYSQDGM